MARSGVWHDPFVESWLLRANVGMPVERVCDIGAGWGRYGMPIRNLFPRVELVGIDAWQGFPKPELAGNYDEWHCVEALAAYPGLGGFDVTLMCDVIEHLEREGGEELLALALRQSRHVIVTAPLGLMRQGEVDGNPWEEHKSAWYPHEFADVLGLEAFEERMPRTFGVFLRGELQPPREGWPQRTRSATHDYYKRLPGEHIRHNRVVAD